MSAPYIGLVFCAAVVVLFGCAGPPKHNERNHEVASRHGPRAIVYKTRAGYGPNVPVGLSGDKQAVLSYPSPSDVVNAGDYKYPTRLEAGYWLDNIGVGPSSAFLALTYSEYSTQVDVSTEQLYGLILDKDPFLEMYDCGDRNAFESPVAQLNALIRQGSLGVQCAVLR